MSSHMLTFLLLFKETRRRHLKMQRGIIFGKMHYWGGPAAIVQFWTFVLEADIQLWTWQHCDCEKPGDHLK